MFETNPANLLGFVILGMALLWSARAVYGSRRRIGDDMVKRTLLMSGWTLVFSGGIGFAVGIGGPLTIDSPEEAIYLLFRALIVSLGIAFVALLIYSKYREGEKRSLLWTLAIAAEKGIPLDQAARAFASERPVQGGVRVARLATLLEQGVQLPQALSLSRNALPADALLAARIGEETGSMGNALRMSLRHGENLESVLRVVLARIAYLVGISLVGTVMITFMMIKIVPVMERIFSDFGLDLPQITEWTIAAADAFVVAWPLLIPLYGLLLLFALVSTSYYVGWSRYELPILHRVWRRCESSLIMRSMALAVRENRDIAATVAMLAQQYPKPAIGKGLARASEAIQQGTHWADALRAQRLMRSTDVAVLKSAERVGNLAWALDEMSESTLRRFAYRLRSVLELLFPAVILLFTVIAAFVAIGMFLPLVSLIEALS